VARASEQLGYPLAEAVIDYALLPRAAHRAGSEGVGALVFAAPRNRIQPLLDRFSSAGLAVDRILTPACAVAAGLSGEPGVRQLVVFSADEATSIAIVQERAVLLERLLPWGLQRLAGRLASELALPIAEARELMARLSNSAQTGEPAPAGECRGSTTGCGPSASANGTNDLDLAIEQILGPALQEIAQEAAACLGYCDSFLQPLSAADALVLGPLSHLEALHLLLEQDLGLAVRQTAPPTTRRGDFGAAFDLAACCALWNEPDGREAEAGGRAPGRRDGGEDR